MQSGRRPGRVPSMGLVSRAAGGRGMQSLPRCGRRNPRPHPRLRGREMQPFCVLCGGPRPRLRHRPPVPRCKELQARKRPQYARGRLAGLRTRTGRIAASGAAVAAVEGEIVAFVASKKAGAAVGAVGVRKGERPAGATARGSGKCAVRVWGYGGNRKSRPPAGGTARGVARVRCQNRSAFPQCVGRGIADLSHTGRRDRAGAHVCIWAAKTFRIFPAVGWGSRPQRLRAGPRPFPRR